MSTSIAPTPTRAQARTGRAGDGAPARRLRPPSWRDPRLLVGVLLVLGSVVGVAALLRAADTTEPVLVARHALVPGQPLRADDVGVARVRLVGAGQPYRSSRQALGSLVVVRAVPAGELVPTSALGPADAVDLRPVTVPVPPDVAAALPTGAVVDVWVAARSGDRADSYDRPRLVAAGVQVSDRSVARASWGGSPASTGSTVRLLLTPALVPDVIQAVDNAARITLVPAPGSTGSAGSAGSAGGSSR